MSADAATTELDRFDREALSVLDHRFGTTTNDVAQTCLLRFGTFTGLSKTKRSSSWLQVLLRLERMGLVRRIDNEKPIAWQLPQEQPK